jgi:hypothetical protein
MTEPSPRPEAAPQAASPSQVGRAGLSTQVEIHDRQQLEIRFDYAIGRETAAQRYEVDTFLFIPRNVGINRSNYSKEAFYGDVTALMRIDATPLPLDKLADPAHAASPLHRFAQAVEAFRTSPRPPPSRPVAIHVKLYAHLFAAACRSELTRMLRSAQVVLRGGRTAEAFQRDFAETLERLRRGLTSFRRVRGAIWPFERLCHESLVEAMRAADEHMSLLVEERLAQLVASVDALPGHHSAPAFAARVRLVASTLAREESAYRRKYGYLSLSRDRLDSGEYFNYRASHLKKTVQQALYLAPREVRIDTFLRNAAGAVAAALAAIWATALAISLPMNFGDVPSGTRTLLFAAAVGAYVLKDRIKALSGEWLGKRLRTHDHTSWLFGESIETVGLGMLRARQRESMHFLHDAQAPADVLRLRRSRRTVRNAEALHEEVIHYRKTLEVGTSDDGRELPEGYRVRDILRLNVRHFLVRLDDPVDEVDYFDGTLGTFARAGLPKVYHLNVVVRVTRRDADGEGRQRLEHLRIVLTKDGIVRIEQLDHSGPRELPREKRPYKLPLGLRLPFLRR